MNTGEKLAGGAAVLLLIVMFFFTWFSSPFAEGIQAAQEAAQQLNEDLGFDAAPAVEDVDTDTGANAWQSFGFIDIILFLAAIAGIGLAVTAATQTRPDLPIAMSAIVAGLAGLAALLVLYRIIDPPFGADRSIGVFLGFLLTAGIAAGGWLAMQEEGASFGDVGSSFGGAPGGPTPAGGAGVPPAQPGAAPPAPPVQAPPPPPAQAPPPPPAQAPPSPPAEGGSQPPPPPPASGQ